TRTRGSPTSGSWRAATRTRSAPCSAAPIRSPAPATSRSAATSPTRSGPRTWPTTSAWRSARKSTSAWPPPPTASDLGFGGGVELRLALILALGTGGYLAGDAGGDALAGEPGDQPGDQERARDAGQAPGHDRCHVAERGGHGPGLQVADTRPAGDHGHLHAHQPPAHRVGPGELDDRVAEHRR